MFVVIFLLVLVVMLLASLGVGVADLSRLDVDKLFPDGYLAAYWDNLTADLGFHMLTFAIAGIIGVAVAAFGGRR